VFRRFGGYGALTVPAFLIEPFKTADFTGTIPGRLNALVRYTKIFAVCFISREGSRIKSGRRGRRKCRVEAAELTFLQQRLPVFSSFVRVTPNLILMENLLGTFVYSNNIKNGVLGYYAVWLL
jgi:hypothetical protein